MEDCRDGARRRCYCGSCSELDEVRAGKKPLQYLKQYYEDKKDKKNFKNFLDQIAV